MAAASVEELCVAFDAGRAWPSSQDRELLLILAQHTSCMVNMTATPASSQLSYMGLLPPNLLLLLCCIIAEQLVTFPSIVSQKQPANVYVATSYALKVI